MQNDGYNLGAFFKEKGYQKIAIYGMGELGNRLAEALNGTDVLVMYGINKGMGEAFGEIEIKEISEEEYFEGVDCIVVTPVQFYSEIEKELKKKCACAVISLEDVIYGV